MNDSTWGFISLLALGVGLVVGIFVGSKGKSEAVEQQKKKDQDALEESLWDMSGKYETKLQKSEQEYLELYRESQRKYQELSYKYKDRDFEEVAAENAYPTDEEDVDPYEISESDFEKDFNSDDVDSTSISYYVEDEVFTDEKDEKISDPEEFLGEENVERFKRMTVDDFRPVVYIRNASTNTVYEIIVENEVGYYRDVLGIDDGLDDD